MIVREWSPHIEAAAEAMYGRLNVRGRNRRGTIWISTFDHYCIAAKLAVDAFHASATNEIEVEQ